MSLKSPFAWIAALVVVVSMTSVARAQRVTVSGGPHTALNPFIEPDYFHPDFQFFAPAEVDPYSGGEPANTGFYFAYDRLYMNVSRPIGNAYTFDALTTADSVFPLAFSSTVDSASLGSGTFGDFTWGNRLDFGYMTPDRIGWGTTIYHITGPNEYFVNTIERANRRNTDDPSDGLGGGGTTTTTEPILQDRNPRKYNISQSLNVASLSSVDLNRVWRLKELHYGGICETYVGARMMNFKDKTRRDSYIRTNTTTVGVPLNTDDPQTGLDEPADPHDLGSWEVLNQNLTTIDNYMFGGQIGFRLNKQTGHWRLSSDIKFFAMQDFQSLTNTLVSTRTHYTPHTAPQTDVVIQRRDAFLTHDHAQEFVWGGELRAEAAYILTRDVSLRGGFTLIDFGRGIGRGGDLAFNQQDVLIAGVTLGIDVNR